MFKKFLAITLCILTLSSGVNALSTKRFAAGPENNPEHIINEYIIFSNPVAKISSNGNFDFCFKMIINSDDDFTFSSNTTTISSSAKVHDPYNNILNNKSFQYDIILSKKGIWNTNVMTLSCNANGSRYSSSCSVEPGKTYNLSLHSRTGDDYNYICGSGTISNYIAQ